MSEFVKGMISPVREQEMAANDKVAFSSFMGNEKKTVKGRIR
jgi:hypothetical protein